MCVSSHKEYFAEQLYRSMKGTGTEDDTLTQILVSHSGTGEQEEGVWCHHNGTDGVWSPDPSREPSFEGSREQTNAACSF